MHMMLRRVASAKWASASIAAPPSASILPTTASSCKSLAPYAAPPRPRAPLQTRSDRPWMARNVTGGGVGYHSRRSQRPNAA